jgi:hypothetical protein
MCIIHVIDCLGCDALILGYKFTRPPLKSDYFDDKHDQHYGSWDRLDLAQRYFDAGENYTLVYDLMCLNPECPRRQPDYTPKRAERIFDKCDNIHCTKATCRLEICPNEELCRDHAAWAPEGLTQTAPAFRVPIYDVDGIRDFNRQC